MYGEKDLLSIAVWIVAAVVEDIWVRTEHGEGDIGFFGKRMVLGQENMELVAAKTVEFQIEALKLMLNKFCVGIIVGYEAKLTPTGCHILNISLTFPS